MGSISFGDKRFRMLDWDKTPGTIQITDDETGKIYRVALAECSADDLYGLHELIDTLVWVAAGQTQLSDELAVFLEAASYDLRRPRMNNPEHRIEVVKDDPFAAIIVTATGRSNLPNIVGKTLKRTDITMEIDKSKWPRGEWDEELDELVFDHAYLVCKILRHRTLGHLCGYVAVPEKAHRGFGKGIYDVPRSVTEHMSVDITFAGKIEMDHLWWFGFDCGHINDFSPGVGEKYENFAYYKNIGYVKNQTKLLAEGLLESKESEGWQQC